MASGSRTLEREVKLETDLAFTLPDLRGVVGRTVREPGQKLRTAYFDTSELRLWRHGISLRHRVGEDEGAAGVWTVKLPGESGRTVDRTELTWHGSRHHGPPEAAALLRGIIRRSPLEQVTELVTTRCRLVLQHPSGKRYGELDDDTVRVVGGRHDGLRFRQLELGLDAAGDAIIAAIQSKLQRAGAQPSNEPKLAKALGLAPGCPQTPSDGIDRHSPMGDVVKASITDALDRITDHDYRLRLDPLHPPAPSIHQARVATRRLRSDLKTLRSVLDPLWLEHTRAELKWLGTVLGAVRDADVLADHLDHQGDSSIEAYGRAELGRSLDEQRRRALSELAVVMSGDRYLDLLDGLQTAVQAPPIIGGAGPRITPADASRPEDPAVKVLPVLVRRQWKTLRRRVRKAGRHPSDEQLHRIRIGAKQFRYAAETAIPVVGRPARRTARASERLQTVLGEHHDAVAAEQWLRRESLNATPAACFAAGLLVAGQARRQRKLRRQWRPVWGDLTTKKRLRWLR